MAKRMFFMLKCSGKRIARLKVTLAPILGLLGSFCFTVMKNSWFPPNFSDDMKLAYAPYIIPYLTHLEQGCMDGAGRRMLGRCSSQGFKYFSYSLVVANTIGFGQLALKQVVWLYLIMKIELSILGGEKNN